MSRPLILLNVALLAASVTSAAYIGRELNRPQTRPVPTRPRTAPQTVPAASPADTQPKPAPATYQVIATRNLFSPTRTETPPAAVAAKPMPALPKPNLFGVVLREGTLIAYLEDPTTKRVAGYRVGDAVAGGTVKDIESDHVVLARPEGPVEVRLRDPSKPRPAPAPAAPPALAPGSAQPVPGAPPQAQPGIPRLPVIQPPPVQQQPQAVQQPAASQAPRPSFSRRRPTGLPSNATQ